MDEFLRTIYYLNLTPIHIQIIFNDSIKLPVTSITIARDGEGDGSGYGDGNGGGYGNGNGDGNGSGSGDGNGSGSGYAH